MVLIPAGEFMMGDHHGDGWGDERPVHAVYLDAFYIDKYEVTNAQYARFLNEYGKNTDAAGHTLLDIGFSYCLIIKYGNTYKPKAGYENHPVIEVTWYGAGTLAQVSEAVSSDKCKSFQCLQVSSQDRQGYRQKQAASWLS